MQWIQQMLMQPEKNCRNARSCLVAISPLQSGLHTVSPPVRPADFGQKPSLNIDSLRPAYQFSIYD